MLTQCWKPWKRRPLQVGHPNWLELAHTHCLSFLCLWSAALSPGTSNLCEIGTSEHLMPRWRRCHADMAGSAHPLSHSLAFGRPTLVDIMSTADTFHPGRSCLVDTCTTGRWWTYREFSRPMGLGSVSDNGGTAEHRSRPGWRCRPGRGCIPVRWPLCSGRTRRCLPDTCRTPACFQWWGRCGGNVEETRASLWSGWGSVCGLRRHWPQWTAANSNERTTRRLLCNDNTNNQNTQ